MTRMMRCSYVGCLFISLMIKLQVADGFDLPKDHLDHAIEEEITDKLSTDLLQSIERKFQADLQRSVDMVLMKIKLLLQNGTTHIQDKVAELQSVLDGMRETAPTEVEECLLKKQNVTTALAEKALHQMVVCGYALIGHDPAQALKNVIAMKDMINQGLKPIREQKAEINSLLKVCGHEHESLKKVIKCVISKSPVLKASMMDVTGKLISGIVELTKLMAHGAMHEACLIEVIKTVEDEAFIIVKDVHKCVYSNDSVSEEVNKYMAQNNATVLDINNKKDLNGTIEIANTTILNTSVSKDLPPAGEVNEMKHLVRKMLEDHHDSDVNTEFKQNLLQLQKNLGSLTNKIED